MKIVIMEPLGISRVALDHLLEDFSEHEVVVYDTKSTDAEVLIERGQHADVMVIANNPLSGHVIEACPQLKMISVAFVGVDHIDLDVCKKRNITISNAAGYCTHAVSELAIGLTLSVLRNIPRCDAATRMSLTKNTLIGHELHKKTFGIIGTGAIGLQTAYLAKAFGCRVIGYNRTEKEAFKAIATYLPLKALMSEADIISIHTPLNDQTHHLINKELLDLMKPSAILINTARGPIVDNQYLSQLLSEEKIAGAGLDVFDIEPPLQSDESLLEEDKVVLTPHVAYATHESIHRRASIVLDNIIGWLNNQPQNIMLN